MIEKINPDVAADYLGIARQTLMRWCSEKRIRYYKIGKLNWFTYADLDAFIDNCAVNPVQRPPKDFRPGRRR